MLEHQRIDAAAGLVVELERACDLSCYLGASERVCLEMVYAVFVDGVHQRLADIVQQHCKAQHPIRLDIVDALADVGINVVAMVRVVLSKVKAGRELWYDDGKDVTVLGEYPRRVATAQQLFKLGGDTLCGNCFELVAPLCNREKLVHS